MLDLTFFQLVFIIFPEYLLLAYVGLGMIGYKISIVNNLKVAVICTFILGFLRNIFFLYGLHTLIMILSLAVVMKLIINIEFKIAFITSLIGVLILGLGETIIISIGINLLQIKMEIMANGLISYLFSYLGKLPIIIIALGIYQKEWKLIDLGGEESE